MKNNKNKSIAGLITDDRPMNFDYSKDKNGYIKYQGKKTKLRKIIKTIAEVVHSYKMFEENFTETRQLFVDEYNKGGLEGVLDLFEKIYLKKKSEIVKKYNLNDIKNEN